MQSKINGVAIGKLIFLICFSGLIVACQSNLSSPKSSDYTSKEMNLVEKYNPKAASINSQLAMGYLDQGDIERAKFKLQLARKQDPNSPMIIDAMAYFQELTGEPQAAEKLYLRAISLDPGNGNYQNNYGAFLCRQGKFEQAEQHFMKAVADSSYASVAEAYENAGLCIMKAKKMINAENYFQKALQKNPHLATSYLKLAQINYLKGNYLAGKTFLDQYIRYAKPSAESTLLGFRIAKRLGNRSEANEYASVLKQHFRNSQEYKDYLASESVT